MLLCASSFHKVLISVTITTRLHSRSHLISISDYEGRYIYILDISELVDHRYVYQHPILRRGLRTALIRFQSCIKSQMSSFLCLLVPYVTFLGHEVWDAYIRTRILLSSSWQFGFTWKVLITLFPLIHLVTPTKWNLNRFWEKR